MHVGSEESVCPEKQGYTPQFSCLHFQESRLASSLAAKRRILIFVNSTVHADEVKQTVCSCITLCVRAECARAKCGT
jgi:hypothetical protein